MATILGLCNPLLDISSDVDQAFMDKYSLKAGEAGLAAPEQMPVYTELAARKDVIYIPGGSGLNTVRVANWQLKKLGLEKKTSYVGSIGKDEFGKILTEKAESEGVKMATFVHESEPTGTCAVAILDKERALLANVAAAGAFPTAHLASATGISALAAADVLYMTSFFFLTNADAGVAVAEGLAAAGKKVALNLSAPFLFGIPPAANGIKAVSAVADYIFCNETEAEAWRAANATEIPEGDLKAVTVALANLPGNAARTAVVTQGSQPTLTAKAGDATALEHPVTPVDKILDTNGAGDAFVGGFLAALTNKEDLAGAVARGNVAAGVIIQNSGCQWGEQ